MSEEGLRTAVSKLLGTIFLHGGPVPLSASANLQVCNDVLSTLTLKQERVIRLRFGIGGEREHTLEEVGQELGLTRQGIHYIEAKALRCLRHHSRSHILRTLLESEADW